MAKVFVLVDGLDEATNEAKDGLMNILPTLGANILITSRPLELYATRTPGALHISIQARAEDIATYVEERVNGSARLVSILRSDVSLAELLHTRVKEKSQGM